MKPGDRIILHENEIEGWVEEKGKIIEVMEDYLIVEVDKEYLAGKGDDGIREVYIPNGGFTVEA